MLSLSNFSVSRGSMPVISGLNLELPPASAVGLVGANGSGKTTAILAILGLLRSQGEITKGFLAKQLGVVWQDRALPLNVGVDRWFKYLADIFEKPVDNSLVERLNIEVSNAPIRKYSAGQQQKIAIVSAFFHKPSMLILDEPTVGLDDQTRLTFLEICKERVQQGSSILITSHISSDLISLTSEIISLSEGKFTAKYFFTTSRSLKDTEISQLCEILDIPSVQVSDSGYFLESSTNIFSLLARYADNKDFVIKSFTELK